MKRIILLLLLLCTVPLAADAPCLGRFALISGANDGGDSRVRLDVMLSMPFFRIKGATSYFQIINALNLDNVEAYSYNADYSKRNAQKGLPVMPVLGMKYEF